ncbi:MAG: hypothetical protein KQJ78_10445 [Deltaproteobacteria bacterium]|nr:hypothetical protein [Deltaproteobacteria bacterium]
MTGILAALSLAFTAGAVGGLVNGVVVWLTGDVGLTAALGINIAPALTPGFLYSKMVWGGIWGIGLLAPLLGRNLLLRGIIWSLAPSLVMLLLIFPLRLGQGWFGFNLGLLTPAYVLVVNAVWGLAAALWLLAAGRR